MHDDAVPASSPSAEPRRRDRIVASVLLLLVVAAIVLTLRATILDDVAPAATGPQDSTPGAPGASDDTAADGGLLSDDARDGHVDDASAAARRARDPAAKVRVRVKPDADPAVALDPAHGDPAVRAAAQRAAQPDAAVLGRYTVFGAEGASMKRSLGESVGIDGNVAVATVYVRDGDLTRGGVEVYERGAAGWAKVQRLDPPQYAEGAPMYAGISGGRIVAVGGFALGTRVLVFRSYVRGEGGAWALEAETRLASDEWATEWVFRGDTLAAMAHNGSGLAVWRVADGTWTRGETVRPRQGRQNPIAGSWISLAGDVAVCLDPSQGNGSLAFFRRKEAKFRAESSIGLERWNYGGAGALARNGATLVLAREVGVLLYERPAEDWTGRLLAKPHVSVSSGRHSVAADGDLAAIASSDPEAIVVLQRRADDWWWTKLEPPAGDRSRGGFRNYWFTGHACIALSGTAGILGTPWENSSGGRVVFFDITDDDLARAAKVEDAAR